MAYLNCGAWRAITCAAITFVAGMSVAQAAPPAGSPGAEHARIVAYWTPERIAAAIPRDLVIDEKGQGYLKHPDGSLQPYGRQVEAVAGGMQPNAKPGGGGTGDATLPTVSGMNPGTNQTIGASYTFQATVTDDVALRSVSFKIGRAGSRYQTFSATSAGDVWSVSLNGFSDGAWQWYVVATDSSRNVNTPEITPFTVSTGSGGGGTGTDVVTNSEWGYGGDVQTAAGRIYFEMPTNAKRTRWAGYVCSGTVTEDGVSGRSIIITAAHCAYDDANKAFARNVMFIPNQADTSAAGTDRDCTNDPLGCWTPSLGVVDAEWTTRTFPYNVKWDYAFYVVNDIGSHSPDSPNLALDGAAKTLAVSFTTPQSGVSGGGKTSASYTYGLGYSYSDDPNFMYCAEEMVSRDAANWWLGSCGLSGGSSGGPWAQPMSELTGIGTIISVNSWGYTNQPGMAGPKLSGSSALCVLDEAKDVQIPSTRLPDGEAGVKSDCAN